MDVSTAPKPPVAVTKAPAAQRFTEPAAHPLKQAAKPAAEPTHKEPQARPLPIVNAQGQNIGRVLNVKA